MSMKLVDELVGRAAEADGAMGRLASQEAEAMRRRGAYDNLQALFEDMASDGYLDKGELDELMKQFRAQGLDTDTLEKLYADLKGQDRVEATASLRLQVKSDIAQEKSKIGNSPMFQFEVQRLMGEYNQAFDLASRVQKSEHDMYMTAVNNMKA